MFISSKDISNSILNEMYHFLVSNHFYSLLLSGLCAIASVYSSFLFLGVGLAIIGVGMLKIKDEFPKNLGWVGGR